MQAPPLIEGYKILEKLGEGATAVVWKAHQISLDRLVVIKILSDSLSKDPEDVKMFLAEAQTAAKLKHSGIVQVYDFAQTKNEGRYYFIMEYVSGYTVGEWARRRGKLKESDAIIIAHHVGEALKYAWEQARVIHCDIKPENLMVDGDGTVKVMDLGLAHIVFSKNISPAGPYGDLIMGTPNYMSPEQAAGKRDLDCRTDIYALGMTLYHALTGVLPYGRGDTMEILDKQIKEPLVDAKKLIPELSSDISSMLGQMTAKNIADRYQNWSEVLNATIGLLHKKRDNPAESAEIYLHDHVGRNGAAPNHSGSVGGEFKECPYCAEPIRKKAVLCRYCGKDVSMPHKAAVHGKASPKLRLKPVAMPVAANQKTPVPIAPPPPVKKHRSNWGGNIRMVISLFLLSFLVYYWYNRIYNERDILLPYKIKLERIVAAVERQWNGSSDLDESGEIPESDSSLPEK